MYNLKKMFLMNILGLFCQKPDGSGLGLRACARDFYNGSLCCVFMRAGKVILSNTVLQLVNHFII